MVVVAPSPWRRCSSRVIVTLAGALLGAELLLLPRLWEEPASRSFWWYPDRPQCSEWSTETPKYQTPTESPRTEVGPSAEYEVLRRRMYENTQDLWRYLSHELRDGLTPARATAVLDQLVQRKRFLLLGQEKMAEVDGYDGWRRREAASVADLVQRRIRALQNPLNCRAARKVVNRLGYHDCGFGCQVHALLYTLQFALASKRTMVLQSKGWSYNAQGWEKVFLPLSDNCTDLYGEKPEEFPGRPGAKVVLMPKSTQQSIMFSLPLGMPRDLADRVARFNGDPSSWWGGQLLRFVLRPNQGTQRHIERAIARMKVRPPYVGIHVRRTDKLQWEAQYHSLDEYMVHVEDYFATKQLAGRAPRRVYVASDNSLIIKQARRKYPTYEFLGDPKIAKTASKDRASPRALSGLLADLHVLAASEHFVGTLSSNVGRLVYEMMQSRRVDASPRVTSLDGVYYLWGQKRERIALTNHAAKNDDEISFRKDDIIQVVENLWNGYGRGTNIRTSQTGLIPLFKTEEQRTIS